MDFIVLIFKYLFRIYRKVNKKILEFLEMYKEVIPFSDFLIRYFKLPFWLKFTIFSICSFVFGWTGFSIGFVILQSRGKNELLSWASAYHNSIDFPVFLYWMYSFVYIMVSFLPVLLFIIHIYLFEKIDCFKRQFPNTAVVQRLSRTRLLFILAIFLATCIYLLPYIPYYLLFSTKGSSIIDTMIQLTRGRYIDNIYMQVGPEFPYGEFRNEVFFSVQIVNIIGCFVIYLVYKMLRYSKKSRMQERKTILELSHSLDFLHVIEYKFQYFRVGVYYVFRRIIMTIKSDFFEYVYVCLIGFVVVLFLWHISFQIGSFGKNLSQFDTDFVEVNYTFDNQEKNIRGYRVYQDKGYVILRDMDSDIHFIKSDYMHIINSPLIIVPEKISYKKGKQFAVKVLFNGKKDVTGHDKIIIYSEDPRVQIIEHGVISVDEQNIISGDKIEIVATLFDKKAKSVITIVD